MPTVNIERLRKLDYRCNEAYKTLRTNIQLCGSDMKVIMFTSSTPNEGKSSVSFNLAVSLAESGKKVIFIDADLRKSVLVGRYKINKAIKGLTHFLSGMNKFEEVICTTNVDNLYVVGMGLGVVFVGLISIIILCYIIGAICMSSGKKEETAAVSAPAAAPAPAPIENRQEIIAAVSAALAEEMGTDISAIRILSFKKI